MKFSQLSASLLCAISCLSAPAILQARRIQNPPVAQVQLPNFVQLVKENGPAVVNIQTVRNARIVQTPGIPGIDERQLDFFRQFGLPLPFGPSQREIPEQRGTGSGFIISKDGIILTNAHVVDGADEIIVHLTDKREFRGKVIGTDPQTDIAVVKIEAKDLPVLKLGHSKDLQVGEWVAAIGSPFGLDNTVTAGIVSAVSRALPSDQFVPFIQTDVAVNPGNSGGPLFNMKGEVVGINSQIFSTSGGFMGLSFAIPIDLAIQIKDQLIQNGHVTRGYIGVYIQELTQELAENLNLKNLNGALITKVEKNSPAEKAGLQAGDVILQINQQKVTSSINLPMIVSTLKPGDKADVILLRDGKELTQQITIRKNPNTKDPSANKRQASLDLGFSLRPLSQEEAKKADVSHGLLVTNVTGIAAKAGFLPGDILLTVNRVPLQSLQDLEKQAKAKKLLFLVQRKNARIFIPLTVK